ncbi:VOC family protein [Pontibacter sp. KCTC 32443]|uniref:VOC family protein n=1 Tax=Pontibacter TaxID=323449 RepID=UPI00164D85C3|nr:MULTISPECIES: VOC family protein [Pontibacter]MBC5775224.1 VOC family protein [Pontibacter sp. KCTC 32443]
MDSIKIKETCLYVTDLAQTKAFYNGLLKFKVIGEVPGRHIFFRVGSSVLLCFIAAVSRKPGSLPPHFGSGQLHLAFEVSKEQYHKTKAEVEQNGIQLEQEYDWGGGFLSFYFRDPDLHLLEVVMEGMWERGKE